MLMYSIISIFFEKGMILFQLYFEDFNLVIPLWRCIIFNIFEGIPSWGIPQGYSRCYLPYLLW